MSLVAQTFWRAFGSPVPVPPRELRFRGDLEDGSWERRYGHLLHRSETDLGYRLPATSGPGAAA